MTSVKNWIFLFLILSLIIWTGCSIFNNESDTDNIVITDDEGNILEDNSPNDWQPRLDPDNLTNTLFSILPAYPNPSESEINLGFAASEMGTLNIGVYKNNSLIRLLIDDRIQAGNYRLRWDLKDTDGNRVISRHYTI